MYKEDLLKAAFKVRGDAHAPYSPSAMAAATAPRSAQIDLLPHPKQGMPELPCNV